MGFVPLQFHREENSEAYHCSYQIVVKSALPAEQPHKLAGNPIRYGKIWHQVLSQEKHRQPLLENLPLLARL
jgi:hypothetical protein